jgi:dihydroflavonol-4-reductase
MTSQAALVTGASGFIGSNLVRRLIERGERVKAFVRPGADLRPFAGLPTDRFSLAYGDVTVVHTVYRALAGCDRIYHVASPFTFWAKDPSQIIETATLGTRATLTACKRRGIENIVVTSSVGVLGVSSKPEPFDENHPLNLHDPEPYMASKIEAEKVVDEFLDAGLPIVSVLPGTTFGPGDWKPTPTGRLLLKYLELSPSFSIPVAEGGINVVDVADVVEGHILAMEQGEIGARYILGGDNLTWTQLFQTLADITGLAEPGEVKSQGVLELFARLLELQARWTNRPPLVTHGMVRDYASKYVWVSSAKAEGELGYAHRPAREALARGVRWFLEQGYVPKGSAGRVRLELRPI